MWRNSNEFIFIVVFAENGRVQCRQMKCRKTFKRKVSFDLRVVLGQGSIELVFTKIF